MNAEAYELLLEATINRLRALKARGVRFVPVSLETLAVLRKPIRPAPTGNSAVAEILLPQSEPKPQPHTVVRRARAATACASTETVPAGAPAVSPGREGRAAAMAELKKRALECVTCQHLAESRQNVVFGVGSLEAELMFVGEAPGADEDTQGEPFVGKAGQLLTKIIQAMGLSRETVYIANILKCRPDTPGQSYGNRKPTPDEMRTCIPFLHEQIDVIKPKVLVALGATAMEGLLGKTGITRLRGQWHTYRGIPLMPTYHPSYLLHNQNLSEKRRVWEDMLQVMEKLDLPISERQKNFFLKTG